MGQIEIKIVKKWPQDDIVRLYNAGGWWKPHYKKSGLQELIEQSYAFAVVVHKPTKQTIGMGRIISDKTSDAYIQDLIILPEHRGKGYGRQLVKKLIDFCVTNKLHWIGLIAEPDQEEFYEKIGFKKMEKHVPMLYEIEGK
jgi:ribosomal protein S18 acetylase RimI-like enzyme